MNKRQSFKNKKIHVSKPINNQQDVLYHDNEIYRGKNIASSIMNDIKKRPDDYNFFMTLATNLDNVDLSKIESKIIHFRNNICSRFFRATKFKCNDLGEINYSKLFRMIGFVEKTKNEKIHYHILGYIHESKLDKLINDELVLRLWKKIFIKGTIDVQKIDNLEGVVNYCCKDLTKKISYENIIYI